MNGFILLAEGATWAHNLSIWRDGTGPPSRRHAPGNRLPGVRGRLFPAAFRSAGVLRASLIDLPALLTLWLLDGIPHG